MYVPNGSVRNSYVNPANPVNTSAPAVIGNGSTSGTLSGGAIAAIVIVSVVFLAVLAVAIFLIYRYTSSGAQADTSGHYTKLDDTHHL